MLPDIEVLSTVTPSPHHPLGVKGIGEAGTIASTATVYNAVIDALEPFGVDNLTMPLTPGAGLARDAAERRRDHVSHRSFDYYRARLDRAKRTQLLQQHPGAKLLAGGHSLIPLLKLRLATPPALIDIGRIAELKGITSSSGTIRIGALTTHAELAVFAGAAGRCPMLAEAAAQIGDPQVRNCGTIGGNVAHADPASDLPTVLVALDARFIVAGPKGERTIAAASSSRA